MISLKDLIGEIEATVPSGGLLSQYRQTIAINSVTVTVQLDYTPEIGSVKVNNPDGSESTQFTVDYVLGTVTFDDGAYPDPTRLFVTYKRKASSEYVAKAVRDLGQRLPQRAVAHVRIGTNGIGDLPSTFNSMIELSEIVECDEADSDCSGGSRSCSQSGDCYECNSCRLFVRGDKLIVHPAPAKAFLVEICYWGGFPLNSRGYFEGLSREFADIAMLKAIAIAYRSPQMTEAAVNSGASVDGGNGGDLVELSYETGGQDNQRTTQRWEGASKAFGDRAKAIQSVATEYESQYESRIHAIQGIAKIGNKRGGYRNKHWRLSE